MKNAQIAKIFYDIADMLEIMGENPFRIRAYRRAAQNLESHSKDLAELTKEELLKIPGVGADLAGKVMEIVATGTCKDYEALKRRSPEGIATLLAIPGLGPKTAKLIYDRFKVHDLDTLEKLARDHRLKGLPKIKEKTELNILRGIEMVKKGGERMPLGRVLPVANQIMEILRKRAPVCQMEVAGSIRRWKETVRDIDILATSSEPEKVMDAFASLAKAREVIAKGPTKTTIIYDGIQADIRVVEEGSFGAALCYFTGSKEHNIRLRELAVKKGWKLNEYGLFDKNNRSIAGKTEEDIYRAFGLQFIPPELREDRGEIDAALKGQLPKLIELSDIKGDLHTHSKWTDGSYTIEQMAEAARRLGYEYIAMSDHSKSLGIARGLNEEKVMEEMQEIDALNKKLRGFRILKGLEVDIKSDGTLDLPDGILSKLDLVNASIHSGFRQSREQITKRITSAMRNPFVTIIAHPTGRVIGGREPYDLNMEEALRTARETGTFMEINAYPDRLDLNDQNAMRAGEMGIRIAISTDSHLTSHLNMMKYGVQIARRAWLEKKDIVNTLGLKELTALLKEKRKRAVAWA